MDQHKTRFGSGENDGADEHEELLKVQAVEEGAMVPLRCPIKLLAS